MENTKNIINFIYQNNTISQNKFGIIESLKNPIAAQEKAFFNLIKNIKDTAIYKELKLDKIKNHYELIKKVPLHDYNFYEKFINKIIAGEENQMFIGKPKYFFSSSGTTNNSKTIPCSNEIFSVFNQSLTEYLLYLYQNLNDISLESDSISIGAKHTIEEINGVQKGYLSGILATSSSRINKYPSPEYFQIDNYSERISKIYFEAKDKDIKLITGVPAHIFAFFNEILNLSGKQKIQEIWPNLKLIIYAGTGVENFENSFHKIMGKKITCLGFYGASEALMGIEIPEISQGMHSYIPLYNDTVFSFTDVDHPHLPPLSFEELKKEGEYYINISSLSGFIQYALKDCIKITSISPYLTFQVLGRQDADLNLVSERISQKTVTEIIAELQNKIQCHIDHYFVYPIIQENCSYYGWILFSDNISIEKSCLIANIFDELLILRSNNYKKYRLIQNLIAVPKVKIIPKHLIQKYFERNSGKGQFKMKTIFKSHLEFEKFWKSEISDLERYL